MALLKDSVVAGNLMVTGDASINGYSVSEMPVIVVDVSASANTSTQLSVTGCTPNHVVLNDVVLHSADVSWSTEDSGYLALSCTAGIPATTLYLGLKK